MWAIVPIKQFGVAKQRLAAILSNGERVALAAAMLRDVLAALKSSARVSGIVVVSKEPAARELADEFGAYYLAEDANDLSLAVAQGGAYVAALGATSMLMVPGDVPLLVAGEVDRLIDAHGERRGLTLAPDRDAAGTNGLIASPVNLIPFCYGINSFQAHADAARLADAPVRVLELEGLALDIDTLEDIRSLMAYDRPSAALRYLGDIEVESRLPPRHNVACAIAR